MVFLFFLPQQFKTSTRVVRFSSIKVVRSLRKGQKYSFVYLGRINPIRYGGGGGLAPPLLRLLKRELRKKVLSGTTEWNRELGGACPPRRLLKRELRKKKACISESMHFSTMHHRRKKSLVDAFYPYLMLKPTKSEKKIQKKNWKFFPSIFFLLQIFFRIVWNLF